MLRKMLAVLYTALVLCANPALAADDPASLREGDMKKLAIHAERVVLPDVTLFDAKDTAVSLSDYHGQWVVLNFWATWCAPCRKEMPSLQRLQEAMPEIAVLPLATGRNPLPGIEKFFASAGITGLPVLRDPQSELARQVGIIGLPVTLILDPQGREVARLIGDAEWDSPSAQAILRAFQQTE